MTDSIPPGLDDLRGELDETFREELDKRLTRMADALAELDRAPDPEARGGIVGQLARDAHSVKGGAMLVGRRQIGRVAGALEARFDAAQSSGVLGPRHDIEAALESIRRLSGATPPDDAEINRVLARLGAMPEAGHPDQPSGRDSSRS